VLLEDRTVDGFTLEMTREAAFANLCKRTDMTVFTAYEMHYANPNPDSVPHYTVDKIGCGDYDRIREARYWTASFSKRSNCWTDYGDRYVMTFYKDRQSGQDHLTAFQIDCQGPTFP